MLNYRYLTWPIPKQTSTLLKYTHNPYLHDANNEKSKISSNIGKTTAHVEIIKYMAFT